MFDALAITPMQATVFGLLTLPITLWVIYTDFLSMKIKNEAVLALLGIYVLAGVFLLPFGAYAWGYAFGVLAFVICYLLYLTIGLGAGDAKFIAAATPFVTDTSQDWIAVAMLYIFWSIVLLVFISVAKRLPIVISKYPDWVWISDRGKRHVPFGMALAPTLTSYFLLGAIGSG